MKKPCLSVLKSAYNNVVQGPAMAQVRRAKHPWH